MTTILRAADALVTPSDPQYFTGTVFQSVLAKSVDLNGVNVLRVTFAPAARTVWHTHPGGQTLHIESGLCLVQVWGSAIQTLAPGDTISIGPGEKHWHGASPGTVMIHLAVNLLKDGNQVDWLERVTDEQYKNV